MEHTTTQTYQHHLVEQIRAKQPLSERVAEAFLAVPRHPFVSHYYQHTPGTREWIRQESTDSAAWYSHLYQDESLVTNVDEHGRTLSSSSQPSIMALMLDALDVEPGMRILEIGTGTGYNAGLLAAITGDPECVTTIDIDAQAIEQASQVLCQVVGAGMTIVRANGQEGYPSHAPYDRMIVTASTPTIPAAWAEQLKPNGVLVCVLQPSHALLGGVVCAEKQGQTLTGRIISTATFMPLRADATYGKRSIHIDEHATCGETFRVDADLFPSHLLRENPHFGFFLYSHLPTLRVFEKMKKGEMVWYEEQSPHASLVFHAGTVELHGDPTGARLLWSRLLLVYSFWLHCGQPRITDYRFALEGYNDQRLFLQTPGGVIWPFVI